MKKSLILFSLFYTCAIHGSQILEMDQINLIKVTFSSRHHNRIVVDNQRIKKVIYPEGDISIRMEEESGQIFVQAMVDFPSPTTISIVTNEGFVQDLKLNFIDMDSEILILKQPQNEECLDEFEVDCPNEVDVIQSAIEILLSGEVPEEYVPVQDRQICSQLKKGVTLQSVMKLVGPVYTIYVFIVENNGCRSETIHESQINCIKGEWVFIEKDRLAKNDKMMALVGVRTYEQ